MDILYTILPPKLLALVTAAAQIVASVLVLIGKIKINANDFSSETQTSRMLAPDAQPNSYGPIVLCALAGLLVIALLLRLRLFLKLWLVVAGVVLIANIVTAVLLLTIDDENTDNRNRKVFYKMFWISALSLTCLFVHDYTRQLETETAK